MEVISTARNAFHKFLSKYDAVVGNTPQLAGITSRRAVDELHIDSFLLSDLKCREQVAVPRHYGRMGNPILGSQESEIQS